MIVGTTPYRGPGDLGAPANAPRGAAPRTVGAALAASSPALGSPEIAPPFSVGMTLVQLAGTDNGPSEAALPRRRLRG